MAPRGARPLVLLPIHITSRQRGELLSVRPPSPGLAGSRQEHTARLGAADC